MGLRDYISYMRGGIAPVVVLVVGTISGIALFGKFKSGKLGFGGENAKVVIAQKKSKLQSLEQELATAREQLQERIKMEEKAQLHAMMETEIQELKAGNAAARNRLESLRSGLSQTTEMFDAYKQRYRNHVRTKAVGSKYDKLITKASRSYYQVEIKSVGAVGINITHRDGSGRIPFKELPDNLQRQFQFNEEEAEAQKKREEELRLKREMALAAARAAAEEAGPDVVKPEEPEEPKISEAERLRAMDKLKEAIRKIEDRIMVAETNLNAEKRKTISRAPQYREELKQLRAVLKKNEARLKELKSMR